MARVSARLKRRIERDFPEPGSAREIARIVASAADSERIQAAIVLAARGDHKEVARQAKTARWDWRDVVVNGGLENEDWPSLLDQYLGG
jgi:hypothetical protein